MGEINHKLGYILTLPFFVDTFQKIQHEALEIDWVYFVLALIGAGIGSGFRISYEIQKKKAPIKRSRIYYISICSLVITIIAYFLTIDSPSVKYMAVISIIGGAISVDIMKMVVEDLPNMIKDYGRKKLLDENPKDNDDSDIIG